MSARQRRRRERSRITVTTAILMVILAVIVWSCVLFAGSGGPTSPDTAVRAAVSGIGVSDVRCMKFWGGSLSDSASDPIVITDKHLIGEFLRALRVAQIGRPVSNRVASLIIELNNLRGRSREAMFFHFFPEVETDCFGPAFQHALSELSAMVAARNASRVAGVASSVRWFQIATRYTVDVKDPVKVGTMLTTLQQIGPSGYAYTASPYNGACHVRLYCANGSRVEIRLVLPHYSGKGPPPLPEPLWSLYEQSMAPPKGW